MALPFMSASEAAAYVFDGAICGMGGFTPAGAPKDVPTAIAEKAEAPMLRANHSRLACTPARPQVTLVTAL
jgi:acyl-CoA hydrolase